MYTFCGISIVPAGSNAARKTISSWKTRLLVIQGISNVELITLVRKGSENATCQSQCPCMSLPKRIPDFRKLLGYHLVYQCH